MYNSLITKCNRNYSLGFVKYWDVEFMYAFYTVLSFSTSADSLCKNAWSKAFSTWLQYNFIAKIRYWLLHLVFISWILITPLSGKQGPILQLVPQIFIKDCSRRSFLLEVCINADVFTTVSFALQTSNKKITKTRSKCILGEVLQRLIRLKMTENFQNQIDWYSTIVTFLYFIQAWKAAETIVANYQSEGL